MHAGFEMLGDMAVGHPAAGIVELDEEIHGSPGRKQHGVLPGMVRDRPPVPGHHHETLAVEVDGVVHGMEGVPVVDESKENAVAAPKAPVDRHVLAAGGAVAQYPGDVL